MSMPLPEYYRYSRSKEAGFGHSASSRNLVKAWDHTKKFLDEFTEYELTLPVEVELKAVDGDFNKELLDRLKAQFGDPTSSTIHSHRWCFAAAYSDDLVLIVFDNSKHEKILDGPISLKLHFSFHWKDLDSKLLENYSDAFHHFFKTGHHGKFSVYISDRVFIQPEFVVPIDTFNKFELFVEELKKHLPYKFQDKSFISFYSLVLKNGKTKYKALGYYGEIPNKAV